MKLEGKLRAGDLFDSLAREREGLDEKLKVENSPLKKLIKIYEDSRHISFRLPPDLYKIEGYERFYKEYLRSLPENMSSSEVTHFSLCLQEDQLPTKNKLTRAGIFLSALINHCKDDHIIIFTQHLGEGLTYLAFRNDKQLIIKGSGGDFLGYGMKKGSLLVEGNVGRCVGTLMRDGRITVEGCAGEEVGYKMKGGHLCIERDVKWSVGNSMCNGLIEVRGRVEGHIAQGMKGGSLKIYGGIGAYRVGSYMEGGEIYIYGKGFRVSKTARGGRIYHNDKLKFDGGI